MSTGAKVVTYSRLHPRGDSIGQVTIQEDACEGGEGLTYLAHFIDDRVTHVILCCDEYGALVFAGQAADVHVCVKGDEWCVGEGGQVLYVYVTKRWLACSGWNFFPPAKMHESGTGLRTLLAYFWKLAASPVHWRIL